MKSYYIFSSVEADLNNLNSNLQHIVSARHPILNAASEHLFEAGGKRIRPIIIFFIAQATLRKNTILNTHKRLAEITEIIHTASLVHDDVIDECDTRRGVSSVHYAFSTKIAVLAGDFLFAQSSWYLANLNNLNVVKAISKVITDFAEGEVRQGLVNFSYCISLNQYIEKSFYKTASLIAASCTGAAMLSQVNLNAQKECYIYGKHIGLAFQIIDDILDIIGSSKLLGKPIGEDLRNGNLTAPILFALCESNELQQLVDREFQLEDDIHQAIVLIKTTTGLEKAKDLATEHIQTAINAFQYNVVHDANIYQLYKNLILVSQYIIYRLY